MEQARLTEQRNKKIAEFYWDEGIPQWKIAKRYGISQPRVWQILKRQEEKWEVHGNR
jgi:DNA-directed RNA polymerase specialized sigma subunit